MKQFLALLMICILLLGCCACQNETTTTKKKVIVIKKSPASSITSSEENSEEVEYEYVDVEELTTETKTNYAEKKISEDIGKDYYYLRPVVAHPGVVGMNATYEMMATDKRFYELDSERIELFCSDSRVTVNENKLIVPYNVRKEGKLTITMKDKKYPNRTGSYTFDFVRFTTDPTFSDDFNTLDLSIWEDDSFDFKKDTIKPIETAFCENGELVLRTTKEDHINGNNLKYEITTNGSFNQAYGCFSAKIKMPTSGLTNVAFWLMSESGVTYIKNPQAPSQSGGELDIVEYFPIWGDYRLSHALHWNGQGKYLTSDGKELNIPVQMGKIRGEYHVYSAVWTENAMYYYFDDMLTHTYTGEGVAKGSGPMRVILQHASYRDGQYNAWAKETANINDFPNESRWDWIKVYGIEDISTYVYGRGLSYKNQK